MINRACVGWLVWTWWEKGGGMIQKRMKQMCGDGVKDENEEQKIELNKMKNQNERI